MFIWHVCAKITRRQPFHGPTTAVLVCAKDGASRDERVLVPCSWLDHGWSADSRESVCSCLEVHAYCTFCRTVDLADFLF